MKTPEGGAIGAPEAEPSPIPGVTKPVFVLSIVSFLTDISSEMILPRGRLVPGAAGA